MLVKSLIITVCLFLTAAAFADNQQYQVELLVFSHLTPTALDSEQWPIVPDLDLSPTSDDSTAFTTVAPDQYILQSESTRIDNQKNYTVLFHQAWIISADALNKPQTVNITTSDNQPVLNGIMRISLNRYFNVHLKLFLNEATNALQSLSENAVFSNAPDTFHFLLDQNRRMRSRELNYIGHPLFGALIKIVPIKIKPANAPALKTVSESLNKQQV